MTFIDLKKFAASFKFAIKGIVLAIRREQSFRVHLIATIIVIIAMLYFKVTGFEALAILIVISMVLVLELTNTIFERIIDVLKPRLHPYVESIKDMMAATVLIASLGALAVGLIIFIPKIVEIFF